MITYKELLSGATLADIPWAHQINLENLLIAVNKLRAIYGKPMSVTSGYRTMQKHLEIYSRKGITDRTKIPMQSNHLIGAAVDFADPSSELYAFCVSNYDVLAECGLYMELGTIGWTHVSIKAPKSGKRGFYP